MTPVEVVLLILAGVAVLLGVVLQRVTGSGVGAVSAPPLVLLLGPIVGVQVLHGVAALCSLVLLIAGWRDVRWRPTAVLTATAVVVTPLGVVLAFTVPESLLLIMIGLIMLAALFTVEVLGRTAVLRGPLGVVTTGVFGGIANGAVGQAGPFVSAYAIASRWPLPSFAASMQVCWLVANVAAIAMKGLPSLPASVTAVLGVALVLGALVGIPASRALPRTVALRWLFAVALVGSVVVLVKGVVALLAPS